MKVSALSLISLISTVCAQTVSVESLNAEQASAAYSSITSYQSDVEPSLTSLSELLATATDIPNGATRPFDDIDGTFANGELTNPTDYASYTSLLNAYITSSVEAEGALQTYAEFYQSVAEAQASIINSVGAAGGRMAGFVGVWAMAMVAAGAAVVLL